MCWNCYWFVCTIYFTHQVKLLKNAPTCWSKNYHIVEIPFGAEIRKCCIIDRGNRDGRKNLPGPDILRINRLRGCFRFYGWWCLAVLS